MRSAIAGPVDVDQCQVELEVGEEKPVEEESRHLFPFIVCFLYSIVDPRLLAIASHTCST